MKIVPFLMRIHRQYVYDGKQQELKSCPCLGYESAPPLIMATAGAPVEVMSSPRFTGNVSFGLACVLVRFSRA